MIYFLWHSFSVVAVPEIYETQNSHKIKDLSQYCICDEQVSEQNKIVGEGARRNDFTCFPYRLPVDRKSHLASR